VTQEQQAALIDALIRNIPSILAGIAAIFAYLAKRKSDSNSAAIEVVHQKVNGLNAAALAGAVSAGQAATQAAFDVGAAQTKAAHAEGHLEGVLTEQERGIREQVRVAQAKVGQTNPPALDAAVGKIADAAGAIADKVAGPEKKSES
jgi:hypothetical protein